MRIRGFRVRACVRVRCSGLGLQVALGFGVVRSSRGAALGARSPTREVSGLAFKGLVLRGVRFQGSRGRVRVRVNKFTNSCRVHAYTQSILTTQTPTHPFSPTSKYPHTLAHSPIRLLTIMYMPHAKRTLQQVQRR